MTITALVNLYLDDLKTNKKSSLQTIKNYEHYLAKFIDFSGEIPPSKITSELIKKYKLYLNKLVDHISHKSLKKNTQNYFLIALRSFLDYLHSKSLTTLNSKTVVLGSHEKPELKTLNVGDLEVLLNAPDTTKINGIRDRFILELLISTGLLVSELSKLNKNDLNPIERKVDIIGKGNRKKTVYLSDQASIWFNTYSLTRKDNFKPLLVRFQGTVETANGGEKMRLTPRSIERVVEKYVKIAKLSIKATPHTLRHTFAKALMEKGASTKTIQERLGHLNVSTVVVYKQL